MNAPAELVESLEQGLRELAVPVSRQLVEGLLEYLDLLVRWNRAYNLTAVRDPAQMISRHLLDSLAIGAFLPGSAQRFLDVGTGAGLPGVPLALLYPQREFHLLDSNGKKTRFLFQVKTALGLDNMTVHNLRAENYAPGQYFDVILSRAYASLSAMVDSCGHLCAPGGRLCAMKGTWPEAEIAALGDRCELVAGHTILVPGLDAERHLIELVCNRQDTRG